MSEAADEPVMFLIEKDGVRECVADVENYPDWAVLQIGDDAVPVEEAEFDGERWAVPIEVLRARKTAEVARRMNEAMKAGYAPASGPLAGHTLQLRNEADKSNWLTSQGVYSTMVAMGRGAEVKARFRTAANAVVVCSYADGLLALLGMAGWGEAVMARSWGLKDAIKAAATADEVEAIDFDAGWPA